MITSVSVVIPTIGRESLDASIESVLNQDVRGIDLIVVVCPDRDMSFESLFVNDSRVLVLPTVRSAGGSFQRNRGMLAVPTDAVAFLDDDDVLSTDSLALRIQEMEKLASGTPLLICGQAQLALPNGQMTEAVPKVLHNSDKDVADYLFAKRSLNPTRNAIFTPTIMVNRQLADLVSWNVELPRHQDWDFVLACQAAGARIVQISHVVAHCAVGSNGSISASSDWLNSLTWVDSVGKNMSPRTSAGLLVSVPLRFALQARSLSGVRLVLVRLAKGRSWPSLSPLLVGLAGMIPRRSLEYAAGTFTRIKHFLKGSRTKNLR